MESSSITHDEGVTPRNFALSMKLESIAPRPYPMLEPSLMEHTWQKLRNKQKLQVTIKSPVYSMAEKTNGKPLYHPWWGRHSKELCSIHETRVDCAPPSIRFIHGASEFKNSSFPPATTDLLRPRILCVNSTFVVLCYREAQLLEYNNATYCGAHSWRCSRDDLTVSILQIVYRL